MNVYYPINPSLPPLPKTLVRQGFGYVTEPEKGKKGKWKEPYNRQTGRTFKS